MEISSHLFAIHPSLVFGTPTSTLSSARDQLCYQDVFPGGGSTRAYASLSPPVRCLRHVHNHCVITLNPVLGTFPLSLSF